MSIKENEKIMLIRNFNTFESQYHALNPYDKQERKKKENVR
jgi:hypothetical protein